ncbi:MAG: hypothetical protein IJ174_10160, partial [Clostridia bacterium]|nr:hypothetical protein [Clostridia bacterium]
MHENQKTTRFIRALLLTLVFVLMAAAGSADESLSRRYPGWTLRASFEEEGDVTGIWTRLVNGLLYTRREQIPSAGAQDWMPVPVTDAFAQQLRAGDLEELIAFEGNQMLFLMPEGLDMERLSAEGTAVWAAVYGNEMTVLDDQGRLLISKRNEYGYYLTSATRPLPEGWGLEAHHCTESRLAFSAEDGRKAVFLRTADGAWQLKQVLLDGAIRYQTERWGILDPTIATVNSSEGTVFGQFPWIDLFTAELATLPGSFED